MAKGGLILALVLAIGAWALLAGAAPGEKSASVPAPAPAAGAGNESAWAEALALFGAKVPEGKTLSQLLGPLTADTTLKKAGALTPREFFAQYQAADEWTRLVMRRWGRARLRELARRDALSRSAVSALLGPEAAGVSGSAFFGAPPIPEESYHALIHYLEFCATQVPGSKYQASDAGRATIDRALQASLAITSPEGRVQYWDFDAVWSDALRSAACLGPRGTETLKPGLLWLYQEMREPAGLDFLPEVPKDLQEKIAAEGGALFSRARAASKNMPASLAAVIDWRCGTGPASAAPAPSKP
jgi:hypothetical protein